MAGRPHLLEDALGLAQEAYAVTGVAEIRGETRAFFDQERRLGARAGLGDEPLSTCQARLDCRLRGHAVEGAQHPRLHEMCTYLPTTRPVLLRQPDRPIRRGAREFAVTCSELCLGETSEKVG